MSKNNFPELLWHFTRKTVKQAKSQGLSLRNWDSKIEDEVSKIKDLAKSLKKQLIQQQLVLSQQQYTSSTTVIPYATWTDNTSTGAWTVPADTFENYTVYLTSGGGGVVSASTGGASNGL